MSYAVLMTPSTSWLAPGYERTQKMDDFGLGETRPGVTYRALRQMEKEGMVVSERDGSACRLPRRRCSITGPGEECLAFWANSLAQYQDEVDPFLKIYEKDGQEKPK